MGCLNVNISLLNRSILCNTKIISGISLDVDLVCNDIINIVINSVYSPVVLGTSDVDAKNHLKVSCKIVCNYADMYYLHVSPEEVVWITDGEVVTYTVESNTDWRVELEGESVDEEQISMLLNSYSLSNNTLISNGEEAIVLVALGNNYMVENSTLLRND